ncbi:MAG: radical SAM protein [Candidatus Eremiobacteraeota bacterium]|nr:radical SAM protein [Candidatus Eremiobacteraeota bacterium]
MDTGPVTSCLAPSFLPATAVLEMTYRCNHGCLFCSCPWFSPRGDFDERPELTINEWKAIIEKLIVMGISSVAFTGGEPLLKEGIEELLTFAASLEAELIETEGEGLVTKKLPLSVHLLSNGKIMSEKILEICARHKIHLGMSMPGLTTFTDHTRASDSTHILKWFTRAKEMGIETHVGITVTRKNLHELYETMAESLLAGADSVLLNRFMPGGRGITNAGELMLDREGVAEMLEVAEGVLRTANRRGNVGTELPLCLVDEGRHTHLKVGTQCSAALDFFAIDPSGYVRVCNHSPVRLHHIHEVEKVKDHPYWRKFALKDYLPRECSPCQEMGRCDGGCREAAHIWSGSPDGPDPLLPGEPPRR